MTDLLLGLMLLVQRDRRTETPPLRLSPRRLMAQCVGYVKYCTASSLIVSTLSFTRGSQKVSLYVIYLEVIHRVLSIIIQRNLIARHVNY
jgi:hypothetical protein